MKDFFVDKDEHYEGYYEVFCNGDIMLNAHKTELKLLYYTLDRFMEQEKLK